MANNLPIDLSNNEELVVEVERSFFGVVGIYFLSISITVICLAAAYFVQRPDVISANGLSVQSSTYISLMAAMLGLLSLIFGYMAATVYWENRMFITNEAVHQVIRRGLFDRSDQRISLTRVESARASHKTMTQRLFGYGTLVFATEGEDVDYSLTYVKNPSKYPTIFYDTQEAYLKNKNLSAHEKIENKI